MEEAAEACTPADHDVVLASLSARKNDVRWKRVHNAARKRRTSYRSLTDSESLYDMSSTNTQSDRKRTALSEADTQHIGEGRAKAGQDLVDGYEGFVGGDMACSESKAQGSEVEVGVDAGEPSLGLGPARSDALSDITE
jgi:hypothetical protein